MLLKKIIVSLMLILPFALVRGQETPKPIRNILGGSFYLWRENQKTPIILQQSPSFVQSQTADVATYLASSIYWGRSVSPNLAFGVSFGTYLENERIEYTTSNLVSGQWLDSRAIFTNRIQSTVLGGWSRYIVNPNSTFQLFAQANVEYERELNSSETAGSPQVARATTNQFSVNGNVGFLYQITPKWRGIVRFGYLGFEQSRRTYNLSSVIYRNMITSLSLGRVVVGAEYLF